MSQVFATYEDYVLAKGDTETDPERVEAMLDDLSAELRAECGVRSTISGDAAKLAKRLVLDAAYGAFVTPELDGFAGSLDGVRQASFSSNGFTQSFTVASGRAAFDRVRLARFKRLVGRAQRARMVYPYGW